MDDDICMPFKSVDPGLSKYGPCLKGRILILEGLISAGKSTAAREIITYAKKLGIKTQFFPEPLIPELLQLFLSDQKKYAFSFQLSMLIKRQAIYREAESYANQGYLCVIDRSLYGDYCFALMHKNRGNISDNNSPNTIVENAKSTSEWKSYLTVLHSEKFEHPDYVVYLKVTPETAIKRCVVRDRQGEDNYDKQYFSELCEIYSSVIPSSPSKQFMTLDWNQPRDSETIVKDILNAVKNSYDKSF